MAIDPSIPLQVQQFRVPNPQEQISLKSLQMQLGEQQRQQKVRSDVLALNQIPGMTTGGIYTDQGLQALSQIDPNTASQAAMHRSTYLNQQSLERQRQQEVWDKQAKDAEEKRREIQGISLNAFYSTPGTPEQKEAARRKSITDQTLALKESGEGIRFGWDVAKLDHMAYTFPSKDDAEGFVFANKPKELFERIDARRAAAAVADTAPTAPAAPGGSIPLSDIGKTAAPETPATAAPDSPQVASSGAIYGALNKSPEIKTEELPESSGGNNHRLYDPTINWGAWKDENIPTYEEKIKNGENPDAFFQGPKEEEMGPIAKAENVEPTEVGGEVKTRSEVPADLRKKAQAEDDKAAKYAALGTPTGNKLAKQASEKAKAFRTSANQEEGRMQNDRKLDQGDRRLDQGDTREARYALAQPEMPPDVADFIADQIWAGDSQAGVGFARNPKAKEAIAEAVIRKGRALGKGGEDLAAKVAEYRGVMAGQRTLGNREAQAGMAIHEANNMIPLALSASDKVDRTNFPKLNQVILAGQRGTGDENVVQFGIAVNSLINIYARAVSPTGTPTVSDKDHARELLETSWTKGQFRAGVTQLQKEMDAALKAPHQTREDFSGAITGKKSGGEPAQPPIAPAPKSSKPVRWEDLK